MQKIHVGNCSSDCDFINRNKYPLKVEESKFALDEARENYVKLVNKNMKLLYSVKNRAKAMKYFDQLMVNPKERIAELKKFKAKGGKIIGTFCLQVPEELIYAAGAIPIRLSTSYNDAIPLAEEIMPKNICQLAKSSVGFPYLKITPYFDLCDVIIIPTTCDAKKKMADVLSNIKKIWVLELPNNREHFDAMDRWQSQVELFKKKIELLTNKKISKKDLQSAIKQLYRRTQLSRWLMRIRKNKKNVINGRDAIIAMQSAFYADIDRWINNIELLCKELEQNLKNNKTVMPEDSPRVMLTGSPTVWPNFKVLNIIEEQGAVIGIDDSCAGTQYFYNPPEVADWSYKSMMRAISSKYLLPTICPVFVHNDDRVDRICEIMQQHHVEGVIYHIIRLCQVMDFDYDKVYHVLQSKNMPILKIETEFGEEDSGQIRTRVEAFMEMIRARRQ